MAKLSVNLNKIALIRNTRALGIPNILRAASLAIDGGADGITVHPRPDGRHVRGTDVTELAEMLKQTPSVEFNIEGNPFHNLLDFVRTVRPQQCTLVPDESGQFTSDHGWDMQKDANRLVPVVGELKALGVRVRLFMDRLPAAMESAKLVGSDRVELYTEPYAQACGTNRQTAVLDEYGAEAQTARAVGLGGTAGQATD